MYDGNNYHMTQTDPTFWVIFLTVVVIATAAMLGLFLIAVARACETTRADVRVDTKDRLASPEPVEGVPSANVVRRGGERALAHAGARPGGAAG